MNSTEPSLDERIRSFADSVRACLDDLPAEEADDISAGLVADLTEQAADGEAPALDDPAAYAAELRTAAGLPDRTTAPRRERLTRRLARMRETWAASIRHSPFGAGLLDLLLSLRPVWWVLRAFAIYGIVHAAPVWGSSGSGSLLPSSPLTSMLLIALTLVSVQWGRDRWLPHRGLRHLRTGASVIAVIALPFVLASAMIPRMEYVSIEENIPPGLLLDGVQVGNIFAYDENGELISRVQLYTDQGTPLELYGRNARDEGLEYGWKDGAPVVPFMDARGNSIWNIYPLDEKAFLPESGVFRDGAPTPAAPPFLRAPGLVQLSPKHTPTPTPTAPGETGDIPIDTPEAPGTAPGEPGDNPEGGS